MAKKGKQQEVELKGIYLSKASDRRSTTKYDNKHDFMKLTLELGERDIWKSYGFDQTAIIAMVREAIEQKKAEQG